MWHRVAVVVSSIAAVACAGGGGSAPASAPSPTPATTATVIAEANAARPNARDIDPVGTYQVNLTAQGSPMTLTAKIDKRSNGWGGQVTGEGVPLLPVKSVTVKGNTMKVVVTAPDGTDAIINIILTGSDISGDWSMTGDGSKITGKKLP